MGTDPRRKSEYIAFIDPTSWAKILDPTKKNHLQEKQSPQNLLLVGLEPCVSLAEFVLSTGLFELCNKYAYVITKATQQHSKNN